jgi:hypothetical protein
LGFFVRFGVYFGDFTQFCNVTVLESVYFSSELFQNGFEWKLLVEAFNSENYFFLLRPYEKKVIHLILS